MGDFQKIDLRVCKVLSAERIPGRNRILRLEVDLGGEVREVVVGGAEHYSPEHFVGKLFIILANRNNKKRLKDYLFVGFLFGIGKHLSL